MAQEPRRRSSDAAAVRVIWSPDALEDIGRIFDYVSLFNPSAAQHLAERLFTAAGELEHFPHRGRRAELAGCRELTVVRPPHP